MPPIVLEIAVRDDGTPVIRRFAGEVSNLGPQISKGTSQPFQHATQQAERFTNSLGSAAKQVAIASAAFLGFQGVTGAVNAR